MKDKAQDARDWLNENCEDAEDSHDFVCRLRNAMQGLDYEEGCPALDFFFPAAIAFETTIDKDRIENARIALEEVPDVLDDLVHTLSAASASAINNKGSDEQINFILDELGDEQAILTLERIVEASSK